MLIIQLELVRKSKQEKMLKLRHYEFNILSNM